MMLSRFTAAFVALALTMFALPAFAGTPVALRTAPIASGSVVTLGDLFENAGAAAAEPIAPAPAPGQTAPLSARFVAAAAQAAGLDWTPPPGLDRIIIGRAGSMRAAAARAVSAGSITIANNAPVEGGAAAAGASPAAAIAIRRGEPVTVSVEQPGLRIALVGRAMSDARVGDAVRVQNTQSNRVVEAIASGPGVATARPVS